MASHQSFRFKVPENKKIRLIIDTDAKNEADDQYAIAHALLTDKYIVKGIIAAHFGEERTNCSMQESHSEIEKVVSLMDLDFDVPVFRGAPNALEDGAKPIASEGCDAIIDEALCGDPRPLYCILLGPLTDIASAIMACPEIQDKLTVIWIGGGAWPEGGPEYNLHNDVAAANIVLGSRVPVWQVPRNVYNTLKVSLAELQARVMPQGRIGGYLFSQMVEFNDRFAENPGWPLGESWVLGDSAAIGLLLDQHEYCYAERKAPFIGEGMRYGEGDGERTIRVYDSVDVRFILEDFYAKLRICYGEAGRL